MTARVSVPTKSRRTSESRRTKLPLPEVYRYIEPGPVVLLTTADKGRANVMTLSWHMMVEFAPPLIACVVSGANFSFAALKATRECVIAIPGVRLARKVVTIGNCSGRDTDKFEVLKLAAAPASRVAAPLLTDCFVNLECKVSDSRLVNSRNLFVLEVIAAWFDRARSSTKTIHHHGYGTFVVDGRTLTLPSKMP